MSKIIYLVIICFCFPVCKSAKQIPSSKSVERTTLLLEVNFKLNKNDYSYQFSFFNKSQDTFSIVRPEISSPSSYFQIITDSNKILNTRCALLNRSDLLIWDTLYPNKQFIVNSEFNLNTFFCNVKDDYKLGFVYTGYYINDNLSGMFVIEIPPTKISDIDSIRFIKKLF